jgi:hypothetical protein
LIDFHAGQRPSELSAIVTDFVFLSAVDDASPSKATTRAHRLGANQLDLEKQRELEQLQRDFALGFTASGWLISLTGY